jgi:3-methyladenine DNA glycosylase AlkD
MPAKPTTHDEFLAPLPPAQRATLEKLRRTIRAIVPQAEECISYGIPGFRFHGKMLVWYGAGKSHCSFFPGGVVNDFRDELKNYELSKGTVRFPIGQVLPAPLVRKLLAARMAKITSAASVIAALRRLADKETRDGMARYGLPSDKAFGVPMNAMQKLAKSLGRNHSLAQSLWDTGWYEARIVACYLAEPERLTPAQMDRWRRDFDNWGVVDTACFALFDRTPHALAKVEEWAGLRDEFGKRAAFALLACLALHDKRSGDQPFARLLPLVERGAQDARNFVKKGVSWALRSIGRRSPALKKAAAALARRLAAAKDPGPRWVGHDALRSLK